MHEFTLWAAWYLLLLAVPFVVAAALVRDRLAIRRAVRRAPRRRSLLHH